jgi:hypothetical protein
MLLMLTMRILWLTKLASESSESMSLIAAFLEESLEIAALPEPLREVWLAIRADGDSSPLFAFGEGLNRTPLR